MGKTFFGSENWTSFHLTFWSSYFRREILGGKNRNTKHKNYLPSFSDRYWHMISDDLTGSDLRRRQKFHRPQPLENRLKIWKMCANDRATRGDSVKYRKVLLSGYLTRAETCGRDKSFVSARNFGINFSERASVSFPSFKFSSRKVFSFSRRGKITRYPCSPPICDADNAFR